MSRPTFTAARITHKVVNECHVLQLSAASGTPGYIMLQRAVDDADDSGIYLEFFHELSSGYDLLGECRVTRERVEIDLTETFARMTGVDVTLALDDAAFGVLTDGLRQIFRGKLDQLRMESIAKGPLFVV